MVELAQLDRGPGSDEPVNGGDYAAFSVVTMLAGIPEVTAASMAPFVRALMPAGAASPIASMMEYPEGFRDAAEVSDGAGLSVLPAGDARDHLLLVIDEASIDRLRACWFAESRMRDWALGLCAAVEAELDSGSPGEAVAAWVIGGWLGFARLFVHVVLQDRTPRVNARVGTALMLLGIASGFDRLRRLEPTGRQAIRASVPPQPAPSVCVIRSQTM